MAANPQFATAPQYRLVNINTGLSASRTTATQACFSLITGSSSATSVGTKVTQIGAKFLGTSSNSSVFIYLSNTTGSSASALLYDEILITAVTPTFQAVSSRVVNTYTDLQLMPNQTIWVGSSTISNVNQITVWASGGDF